MQATERKKHLISKLKRLGVYLSKDNRHIEVMNEY